MKIELTKQLQEMSKLMNVQDNRATADPMYLVQERVKEWGIDPDYDTDGYIWYDLNAGEESSEEDTELLESESGPLSDRFRHEKRYFRYRWEYVTSFFTEKAADQFIKSNSYHYDKARVYVGSAWRNYEWQAIRSALMEAGAK